MPKVGVAPRAKDFLPVHPMTVVRVLDHILRRHWLEKAWPPGARIKLRLRREQRQPATNAIINPRLVLIVKGAAKGRLRPLAARDSILVRRQLLPPFGVGLDHFGGRYERAGESFVIQKTYLQHNDLIGGGGCGGVCRGRLLAVASSNRY